MNRDQKIQLVSTVKESLLASNFVVLMHYRGLSDKSLYDLRVSLKSKGIKLKIAKNTLVKVAIKDTDLNILAPYLTGPTAIAYSDEPTALAKILVAAAKENQALKIQAGYLNKSVLSKDAVDSLSRLGSLEEVRAQFLSTLTGAQSKFVRILNAPGSGMVALLNNYVSSKS
jgi:large subunit ribosomal protein L10